MERSTNLAVALLAVLKTGAAFVPLEPTWPPSRIAEVCASARLAAVLTMVARRYGCRAWRYRC